MVGKLYIVATPIGNLQDITLRALQVLKEVDIVVCEDTRVTKKLLSHYELNKKLLSYHHHSAPQSLFKIKEFLVQGKSLAYVTDAGTPGISDPGNKLVEFIIKNLPAVGIIPIPGASALIAALSVSGFPTDRFYFKGFIPHKKSRKKFLEEIKESKVTNVFYESVHRIQKLLSEIVQIIPEREIVLARELTKQHETIYRGRAAEVRMSVFDKEVKGEFVVVIRGRK